MASYAIGDIQGCWRTLERLLARIRFDAGADRLLLVGDLVNRGPLSLEVLRWAHAHARSIAAVLGNHDLHLIAAARGGERPAKGDTLESILAAPDREQLVGWLASLPLVHCEDLPDGVATPRRRIVLLHAGLPPFWSSDEAQRRGDEVAAVLGGRDPSVSAGELLAALRAPTPDRWDDSLAGPVRLAFIVRALTRMRACAPDGALLDGFKEGPGAVPAGYAPWFAVPHRRRDDELVVCGHWAALGLHLEPGVASLDTGCVWGGELTALRLDDGSVHAEPCADDVVARRR